MTSEWLDAVARKRLVQHKRSTASRLRWRMRNGPQYGFTAGYPFTGVVLSDLTALAVAIYRSLGRL